MQHLAERVEHAGFGAHLQRLRRDELRELEPELEGRFGEGLYLSPEGEIDPRSLLPSLVETLRQNGATLCFETEVQDFGAGRDHGAGRTARPSIGYWIVEGWRLATR